MKGNLVTGALAALALGLCVSQAALFMRMKRIEERLGAAPRSEARRTAVAPAPETEFPPAAREESSSPTLAPEPGRAPEPRSVPSAAPSRQADPGGPVTAAQVEEIVKRALKERDEKDPMRAAMNFEFEDPIVVMERELQLAPSQKLRIQEHLKARDSAYEELMEEGKLPDMKRMREIEETAETAIKRELDYAQQQKYDELKKSGKLMGVGGGAVFIHRTEKKDE